MTELTCDGMCKEYGGHRGTVKRYLVSGNGFQKDRYDYCDAAAELDRQNGFEVVEASHD